LALNCQSLRGITTDKILLLDDTKHAMQQDSVGRSRESDPAKPSSSKSRKGEPNDVFAALTSPAKVRGDYTQIGISIPKSHMRVLDSEASLLGLRKSQFLELLFLRALGQNAITRLALAPTYELKRDELTETVKYLWYIRKEVKKLVDEFMVRTGMKASSWVVMALNEWAGLTRDMR